MAGSYIKQRVEISQADFTAIVAPINCNYFGLKNLDGSALTIRTDLNDANTEDTVGAGMQEGVTAPGGFAPANPYGHADDHWRFLAGDSILWVKATEGTGPVVVTWVA